MTLACQRPRAVCPIRQRNTTLLLNINRPLSLSSLRFGLIFLLFLLRLLVLVLLVSISLALLAFFGPIFRRPFDSALRCALLSFHRVISIPFIAFFIAFLLSSLGSVRCIPSLLLLPCLLLLRPNTAPDMICSILLEDRPLACLAHYRLEVIFLSRLPSWKSRHRLLIDLRQNRRRTGRVGCFFVC